MSDEKQIEVKQQPRWIQAIEKSKSKFLHLSTPENYERESMFAYQAVLKNDYLMKIAEQNPQSLRNAVINIAAIGISLNPALGDAYIVPRDNAAVLDISYKGLIRIATDTGSIKWAQAELVYENDNFVYRGPATAPLHECDPFGDRGEFRGVYCIAKTADDDILVEVMSAKEIHEVRDKSELYKHNKIGPWKDWFGEMAKKTVIKRASKTWPKTDKIGRLEHAIEVLNQQGEGVDFDRPAIEVKDTYTEEQFKLFQQLIESGDSLGLILFQKTIPQSAYIDLYNAGEKGQKVKLKQKADAMSVEGREILEAVQAALEAEDINALAENIEGCHADLLAEIPSILPEGMGSVFMSMLAEIREAA